MARPDGFDVRATRRAVRHVIHRDVIRRQADFERLAFMSRLTPCRMLAFFAQTGRFFLQSSAARRLAAVAAGLGNLIFERLNPCRLLVDDLAQLEDRLLHGQDERDEAVFVKLLELGGIKWPVMR